MGPSEMRVLAKRLPRKVMRCATLHECWNVPLGRGVNRNRPRFAESVTQIVHGDQNCS